MKSFIEFMEQPSFHQDNPGGEWLRNKQEDASINFERYKGLRGATTGYFNKTLNLPVEHLIKLPGARDEHLHRDQGPKFDVLSQQIGHPSNFSSKENPIMIGVNHNGQPYVMEGNHRLAYAAKHGISHIHAEVKYYNGGEDVKSAYSPNSLQELHKPER